MATWVRGFILEDIAAVVREFQLLQRDLRALARARPDRRAGINAQLAEVRQIQLNYIERVDAANRNAAKAATATMKDIIKSDRKRTATGKPGLGRAVLARPLPLPGVPGVAYAVGIGDEGRLNKVTNPFSPGYGPYWRAVEYGTGGGEVPSQVGRVIYGLFVGKGGGGDPERPRSIYGGGGGPHPIFVSAGGQKALYGGLGFSGGAGGRGGRGGLGTIKKEIEPMGFIAGARKHVLPSWKSEMERAESLAIRQLAPLMGLSGAVRSRRRRY